MSIIEARDLVKRYGSFTAVDGIGFSVDSRECFGFLGANGAGKSSTMRMIACVSPVTDGELSVNGKDVKREGRTIRGVLGVVPQDENLDHDLSVLQNLLVYGRYFDLPARERWTRAQEALEFMELADRASAPIDTLSGGMKRRLLIARALINRPEVLILDEPTTGLDPHARHLVWQRLRLLKTQGTTTVLSTHYMDEAAHLCDRLVIMDHGHILAVGAPRDLIAEHASAEVVELRVAPWDKEQAAAAARRTAGVVFDTGDSLLLFDLNGHSLDLDLDPDHTTVIRRRANLEDVFLRLTGRGLSGE